MSTSFVLLDDGSYLAANVVLGPCVHDCGGQVHPRVNAEGTAHIADQCAICGTVAWHDCPFYLHPSMMRTMAEVDPKHLVVGRINGNGAEIHQSDLEHVALLGFANELVRRAKMANAQGTDAGNVRAAALMDAANSIRYVLNMPAEVLK